jgi:hypothetical protein
MRRRVILVAILAVLIVGGARMLAHERFRFVGTVTKKTATEMWMTTAKDNKTIGMDIDEKTKFTRDKKPIPASEVKVGASVVVDALGDDEFDLVALEVRVVPPIAPAKSKSGKSSGN